MSINLWVVLLFSFVGLLDTLYLSYHTVTQTPVACWWFPKEWCAKVQKSSYSRLVFGIPNSFVGLCMYTGILVFLFLFVKGMAPLWFLQGVVAVGFAFSLLFTYIQGFVLKAFCTWCVISAFNFTVMFFALFLF